MLRPPPPTHTPASTAARGGKDHLMLPRTLMGSRLRAGVAVLTAACSLGVPCAALADEPFDAIVQDDVRVLQEKLILTSSALAATAYPHYTRPSGTWLTT